MSKQKLNIFNKNQELFIPVEILIMYLKNANNLNISVVLFEISENKYWNTEIRNNIGIT